MKLDLLGIAVHPDDIELNAAGTFLKTVAQGKTTGIIDLTAGELGTRGSAEIREEEAKRSAEILGLSARKCLNMADGFFENNKTNQLLIVEQIRKYQPEIVITNAVDDRHPDHGRASKLVSDACFLAGLKKIHTSYEGEKQEAWRPKHVYHMIQDRHMEPNFIVDVTEFHEKKMEAVRAFSSQFFDPNSKEPETPISGSGFMDFVIGRSVDLGRRVNAVYGEGFVTERPVGVDDLFLLK